MEPIYKKKILVLGSLCLAFLGLIFALSSLRERRIVQKKAYGAGTLTLTSSVASPAVGQDFWVEARVNTSQKVSMFDLVINYDKNIVEVMPAGETDAVVNPLYDCRTVKTDDNNGKIILQGTIKNVVCGTGRFEDNPQDQVTGNVFLAKFKVKGNIAGNPGIVFGDPIIIYGYNPEQADTIITVTEKRPLNISIGDAAGPTATPTPESCSQNAWDKDRCRRCNVPAGTGWVWNRDCSDFGRWGPTPPTDPDGSLAAYCACDRRCYPAATPPPACLSLTPTPTVAVGLLHNIDRPQPNQSYTGPANFSGWTVWSDGTAVKKVEFYIDTAKGQGGTKAGEDLCDEYRPDLDTPVMRAYKNSGWTWLFNPSLLGLSNGEHRVYVYAVNDEGRDLLVVERIIRVNLPISGTPTPTPTPESCSHNEWDKNGCRRCNKPAGSGWVWSPDCSDFGRWGPTPPTDPDGSLAAYCACDRRCYPAATPPVACRNLTPAPQTPTPTPTPGPCSCPAGKPVKRDGNANCDEVVNLEDFAIWRDEFLYWEGRSLLRPTKTADFDCNEIINIVDYGIWYIHYIREFLQPTPTI